MSPSTRPALIIYGNCQAEFIGLLLSRAPSLTAHVDVAVASNNVQTRDALEAIAPYADRAVLFWEQHDQRPEVETREAVRSRLPSACTTLRYPAVGLNAFWPFFIKDKRNVPEPGFPFGRYPSGDRVAAEIAQLDLPPEQAYLRYMELSAEKLPDLDVLVARDASVQARRDAACDVAMSDAVFPILRSTYQFWTHGHLAASVYAHLVPRLLQQSSDVIGKPSPQTYAELEAAYEAFPGQGEFQSPIHPLVIERLGLQFADEGTKYRWFGNSWTFEEYVKRYLAFDRSW